MGHRPDGDGLPEGGQRETVSFWSHAERRSPKFRDADIVLPDGHGMQEEEVGKVETLFREVPGRDNCFKDQGGQIYISKQSQT